VADDETTQDADTAARAAAAGYPGGPRSSQRNFAERLFPGPSKEMSQQAAERVRGLLQPLDEEARAKLRDDWRAQRKAAHKPSAPAVEAAPAPTADDTVLHELLEQQNELLRTILSSTIDTQADARSTAQNSRTFAWAGTAIALLTLIATVISVVAAIQGH
jgi:hypothetical protein